MYPFVFQSDRSPTRTFWRSLIVASLCVILRTMSFIFTLLPSPNIHCEETYTSGNHNDDSFDSDGNRVQQSISDVFFAFGTDNGCGDLIFSSHTMYALTVVCMFTDYLPKHSRNNILFITFLWSVAVALGLLAIAQRSHYTVDVIIAFYVVPLVWIFMRFVAPWDIKKQIRFWRDQPIVTYLEPDQSTSALRVDDKLPM